MPKFFLTQHCYACIADGYLVFLDAKHGTYSGLAPSEARQALMLLQSKADPRECDEIVDGEAMSVIAKLKNEGLVTSDQKNGKILESLETMRATSEAIGWRSFKKPAISIIDVIRFVRALAMGVLLWKILPFRFIHRLRLSRRYSGGFPKNDQHWDQLDKLVTMFSILAPFFYSQTDKCFLNSLTMTEFLRSYGIGARWIFGVSTEPFAAHCWTQVGNTVVGDDLSRIWSLTPIMVI